MYNLKDGFWLGQWVKYFYSLVRGPLVEWAFEPYIFANDHALSRSYSNSLALSINIIPAKTTGTLRWLAKHPRWPMSDHEWSYTKVQYQTPTQLDTGLSVTPLMNTHGPSRVLGKSLECPCGKKYTLAYETLTGWILFFYSIHDISKHNHRLLARDCLVTVDLVSNVCCLLACAELPKVSEKHPCIWVCVYESV